jgi:hypothetical protein
VEEAVAELRLKRGFGMVFRGENWRLAGDARWERHPMYVPNGREPLAGTRQIGGVEHAVFRCLDDDFLAQPVAVCELPVPEDPLEILSIGPPIDK